MSTTKFDLEKILAKVTALLAKADSTDFPEEAKTYRAKAEELMRNYRIAEEDLIASDQTNIAPEWLEFDVCSRHNPYRDEYISIIFSCIDHVGAQGVWWTDWKNNQAHVSVVGYSGDLRMLAWLFNAARLVFKERLEPEINPSLSEAENIYRLRQAGIERQRVARMMWGEEIGAKASAHAKVGKIYKEECDRRGESVALDGRGISLKDFRSSYASNFVSELHWRLWEARQGADVAFGAVSLHGRDERVKEALYARYPQLRPKPKTDVEKPDENANKKPAKERRWTKADERRAYRASHSPAARAGREAGMAAAREVEIDRTKRAQRIGEA